MKKSIKLSYSRKNRRFVERNNAKKNHRHIFILATMPAPIHVITAVLDVPTDYPSRLLRFQELINACTDNVYVTVPPTMLTQANTHFTAYKTAGTVAERDAAFRPIHNDLKGIMSLFQSAGDANPENAIVIIESGKFKVKQLTLSQKHQFELHNGLISGTVQLTAEGGPQRSCHDWYYSPDGITFTRMTPTVNADTDKAGLTPGEYAYFTHELITSQGPQGVSQIMRIMVL